MSESFRDENRMDDMVEILKLREVCGTLTFQRTALKFTCLASAISVRKG